MSKKSPKENLKSLSWIYIILVVIYTVVAIVCNFVPSVSNILKDYYGSNDIILALNVSVVVNILTYLWYFWLARRVADGKSKGTLYMVLLILGLVGQIVSVIMARSLAVISAVDFIADAMGLYYLCKIKSED